MLIDTHAHLTFASFNKDRDEVIKRAFEKGIEKIINVGTDFNDSKESVELAEKYENIFAAIGLHPINIKNENFDFKNWQKLGQHPKVVAIGEIGLDFFHKTGEQKKQKEIFEKQIKLAVKLNKPVIIHCRDAYEDLIKILELQLKHNKIQGLIHCFSKNYKIAKKFLELGFFISFTGNITYHNKEQISSIQIIPLNKIIIETDCPFLSPIPFQGQRNEPSYVKYVAQKIAEIKNIKYEKVAEEITKNTKKLFNF